MLGSDCLGCGCECVKPCSYVKGLKQELKEVNEDKIKIDNHNK